MHNAGSRQAPFIIQEIAFAWTVSPSNFLDYRKSHSGQNGPGSSGQVISEFSLSFHERAALSILSSTGRDEYIISPLRIDTSGGGMIFGVLLH